MSKAQPNESMAPGSSVPSVATPSPSTASGKQRETAKFAMEKFLGESNAMMDKIKRSAENVTTCQGEIDQVFGRACSLLEALSVDSKSLDQSKMEAAAVDIEELLKDLHKHVQRFAIYGRPKAFVQRDEITAYFETFNVRMDNVLKNFATAEHPDVENWEGEYYQAKLDDEGASYEQLWEIMNDESDLKIIMEMGAEYKDKLKTVCTAAVNHPRTPAERKNMLANAVMNLESRRYDNPVLTQPSILLEDPLKNLGAARLAPSTSRASSSASTRLASQQPPSLDPTETPGARAKRKEAERERALAWANGNGDGYEEPTLPRWEPRRPPPGRGPGSIDETTDAAKNLGTLTLTEEQGQGQAPGWAPRSDVPEDLPPSYS